MQIVQALEWPDRELISKVEEEFPDAGVASVEEARVTRSSSSIQACGGASDRSSMPPHTAGRKERHKRETGGNPLGSLMAFYGEQSC